MKYDIPIRISNSNFNVFVNNRSLK